MTYETAKTVIETLCERVRTLESLLKYYQDKYNEMINGKDDRNHETYE